ncbi:SAM-dependent methyltransferase [Paenibacillus marchantiophytorum]|uniref:SAM-dependent methyltransferase n=1 Tax=Paenibacillus marchantiophytorum TaxID=1619310 RepID=A0ABQ2BQK8_9BACL|nr:class I SAM-dependent methyltransferase [Paenibacillus marchantiophytorum]GGI45227.1 SAM-dependent methyltransferase [Paenibacillus marchantiophytorum]
MTNHSHLQSRFILASDPSVQELVYPLPETWWSRPYEYAWCTSFMNEHDIALDAACGVPHPFKFALGQRCQEAYACDWDARIHSEQSILDAVRTEINEEAVELIKAIDYKRTRFTQSSITHLPYADDFFDKIYCISVVEHMDLTDMRLALKEFRRTLKADGYLLLTLDFPTIDLTMFRTLVQETGLAFAYDAQFELPADALYNDIWGRLYCFRAVLKRNTSAQE